MADAKTKPTAASVAQYLKAVPDAQRRADANALVALMKRVTKQAPTMWGPSIIGFGSYHYKYASGHEGDAPLVAFSARKSEFSLYGLLGSARQERLLDQLGKHKAGKGCLYVKRLADIDVKVFETMVAHAFAEKRRSSSTTS